MAARDVGPPSSYRVKQVNFFGRRVPIVMQNENGPCPLLAIANVLLLRNQINIRPDSVEIYLQDLMTLVANRLLEASSNTQGKDDVYMENQRRNLADVFDILHRLATGIDVNVKFRSINDFEFTTECVVFDLLDINLVHGWLIDPQDEDTMRVINVLSYNELMEKLVALHSRAENLGFNFPEPAHSIAVPPPSQAVQPPAPSTSTLPEPASPSAKHDVLLKGGSSTPPSDSNRGQSMQPSSSTERPPRRRSEEEEEANLQRALLLSMAETREFRSNPAMTPAYNSEQHALNTATDEQQVEVVEGLGIGPQSDAGREGSSSGVVEVESLIVSSRDETRRKSGPSEHTGGEGASNGERSVEGGHCSGADSPRLLRKFNRLVELVEDGGEDMEDDPEFSFVNGDDRHLDDGDAEALEQDAQKDALLPSLKHWLDGSGHPLSQQGAELGELLGVMDRWVDGAATHSNNISSQRKDQGPDPTVAAAEVASIWGVSSSDHSDDATTPPEHHSVDASQQPEPVAPCPRSPPRMIALATAPTPRVCGVNVPILQKGSEPSAQWQAIDYLVGGGALSPRPGSPRRVMSPPPSIPRSPSPSLPPLPPGARPSSPIPTTAEAPPIPAIPPPSPPPPPETEDHMHGDVAAGDRSTAADASNAGEGRNQSVTKRPESASSASAGLDGSFDDASRVEAPAQETAESGVVLESPPGVMSQADASEEGGSGVVQAHADSPPMTEASLVAEERVDPTKQESDSNSSEASGPALVATGGPTMAASPPIPHDETEAGTVATEASGSSSMGAVAVPETASVGGESAGRGTTASSSVDIAPFTETGASAGTASLHEEASTKVVAEHVSVLQGSAPLEAVASTEDAESLAKVPVTISYAALDGGKADEQSLSADDLSGATAVPSVAAQSEAGDGVKGKAVSEEREDRLLPPEKVALAEESQGEGTVAAPAPGEVAAEVEGKAGDVSAVGQSETPVVGSGGGESGGVQGEGMEVAGKVVEGRSERLGAEGGGEAVGVSGLASVSGGGQDRGEPVAPVMDEDLQKAVNEGVIIEQFFRSSANQLTYYGLFMLQEQIKENQLCVFFRNNHFNTMFKHKGALYLLATDQGYLNQHDLVWEKLSAVDGDTQFATGTFEVFRTRDAWTERDIAEYMDDVGSRPGDADYQSDLQLAIALQQQELSAAERQQSHQSARPQPSPTPRPHSEPAPEKAGPSSYFSQSSRSAASLWKKTGLPSFGDTATGEGSKPDKKKDKKDKDSKDCSVM